MLCIMNNIIVFYKKRITFLIHPNRQNCLTLWRRTRFEAEQLWMHLLAHSLSMTSGKYALPGQSSHRGHKFQTQAFCHSTHPPPCFVGLFSNHIQFYWHLYHSKNHGQKFWLVTPTQTWNEWNAGGISEIWRVVCFNIRLDSITSVGFPDISNLKILKVQHLYLLHPNRY